MDATVLLHFPSSLRVLLTCWNSSVAGEVEPVGFTATELVRDHHR